MADIDGKSVTPQVGDVETISFDLTRNLLTILGEDHYPFAEFLYHELVANAWDEDATEVDISEVTVVPATRAEPPVYNLTIRDNGGGMDMLGLKDYFTLGQSTKPGREHTPRFRRPLIGRLGVGKVSILKVSPRWKIVTENEGEGGRVRLIVSVDVDQWISGAIPSFAVQYVQPTGRSGTEIVLEGVQARMRKDRILRMLQRLPLGDDFKVWRNGDLIAPKNWFGDKMIQINRRITWSDHDRSEKRARIEGEIWIRPEDQPGYIHEPSTPQNALERDPAGIDVRVNRDVIRRDFFGLEAMGHGINRIWGWVEVPWLPIVGNRTDWQRDTPAAEAFEEAMRGEIRAAFGSFRYEKDATAQKRRRGKSASDEGPDVTAGVGNNAVSDPVSGSNQSGNRTGGDSTREGSAVGSAGDDEPLTVADAVASRYGEVIFEVLRDHPEFAPTVPKRVPPSRGRPAQNRMYPVRPSGEQKPFEVNKAGQDLAILKRPSPTGEETAVVAGSALRSGEDSGQLVELGEMQVAAKAGIRLQFASLGLGEAPYRWSAEPAAFSLDINVDHPFYRDAAGRPGTAPHRLLCSWLVTLALLERQSPIMAQRVTDQLETLGNELFNRWSRSGG